MMSLTRGASGDTRCITRMVAARMPTSSVASRRRSSRAHDRGGCSVGHGETGSAGMRSTRWPYFSRARSMRLVMNSLGQTGSSGS